MVAGHLQEKNGYYHMVLNYVDEYGKRHTPSKSTGLTVKGNKKRAEKTLSESLTIIHRLIVSIGQPSYYNNYSP